MEPVLPELVSYLESLPEPHILFDRQYRIAAANAAYRRLFSPQASVVGRTCYEVSHRFSVPCDQAGESCPLVRARASAQPERVLHLHHTPQGEEYVNIELVPLRNAAGELAWFIEKMEPLRIAQSEPVAHGLIGRAPAFQQMLELVARVGPSEASVLLLGESGTGKELLARAVHEASARAAAALVVVDCASLPETLFESELFGHERGAFTGANAAKLGLAEAAHGGTLFLDEVGDIPPAIQVKLLRLLESGTYRRVGSTELRSTNVRVISATHRDLQAMVAQGLFRQDLYYRLSTFPIRLPALRERRSDIDLLAQALLQRVAPRRRLSLHAKALECLHEYMPFRAMCASCATCWNVRRCWPMARRSNARMWNARWTLPWPRRSLHPPRRPPRPPICCPARRCTRWSWPYCAASWGPTTAAGPSWRASWASANVRCTGGCASCDSGVAQAGLAAPRFGVDAVFFQRDVRVVERGELRQRVTQELVVLGTVALSHGLQMRFQFQPVFFDPVVVFLQAVHMGQQRRVAPLQQTGEDKGLFGFVVLACRGVEEGAGMACQQRGFGFVAGMLQQVHQALQFGQHTHDRAVRFVQRLEAGQGRRGWARGPGLAGGTDSGGRHGDLVETLNPFFGRQPGSGVVQDQACDRFSGARGFGACAHCEVLRTSGCASACGA
jgi:two-component system response regulator HydG